MNTVFAIGLIVFIAFATNRSNNSDRKNFKYDQSDLFLHIRQDLKFLVFLAGGIIVMLGVVADNLK